MSGQRGKGITVSIVAYEQKGELAQETVDVLISVSLVILHRRAHRVAQRLGIVNPRRTVISYLEQINRRARLVGDSQESHAWISNEPRLWGVQQIPPIHSQQVHYRRLRGRGNELRDPAEAGCY